MVEAGEDPRFIARRLVILRQRGRRAGRPDRPADRRGRHAGGLARRAARGRSIPLAQAVIHLALAPKSNAGDPRHRRGRGRRAGRARRPGPAAPAGRALRGRAEARARRGLRLLRTTTRAASCEQQYAPDDVVGRRLLRRRPARRRARRSPTASSGSARIVRGAGPQPAEARLRHLRRGVMAAGNRRERPAHRYRRATAWRPPRSAAAGCASSRSATTPSCRRRRCSLDDPNLLFVNAGMVPFKPYFLGQEQPAVAARDQRPEVRAHPRHRGGRQDHAARHVLPDERQLLLRRLLQGGGDRRSPGSWSPAASPTAASGFPEDQLWVTVYQDDDEAVGLWKRIAGVPDDRIVRLGKNDNYWSHGRPRPGRSLQRDLLRPRPRVRPRRRPGRRRGPLPRVLEPRLHAVRAQRRAGPRRTSTSSATCRPRTSTPGWASSGSRASCRASTTSTRSTRSGRSSTGRGAVAGKTYGADHRRRRAPARRRRPRAHRADAHRRRRHPRQRGTRLRAAPDDPARRAQHAPARCRRADAARAARR